MELASGARRGSTNVIWESILALSKTPDSAPIALSDIRTRTHELVCQAGDKAAQARLLQDVFEMMIDGTEVMNEVLTKAWGMFIDDGLWRAIFETKEKALEAVDTAALKDLRKRATGHRNRKERYFGIIRKAWGGNVQDWNYSNLGEHYLSFVSRVATRWTYQEATDLIDEIRKRRLLKGGTGRQGSRDTVTRDWGELSSITDEKAVNLLRQLSDEDTTMIDKHGGEENSDAGNEDDIKDDIGGSSDDTSDVTSDDDAQEDDDREDDSVDQSMDDDDDGENDDDEEIEGDFDSGSKNVSPLATCKCRKLPQDFLKRISRRNAKSAGLDSHGGLMKTLKVLVKPGISLDHVCYKHLKDYGAHFGLQVKFLKADMLRHRLGQSWEHRQDLDAFKTSAVSKLWWRRTSRPHIEEDDHGVFAHRPRKDTLMKGLATNHGAVIIEEIAGKDAYGSWADTGNLIVKGMFSWLWDGIHLENQFVEGVGDLISEEFDMYRHHQAEQNVVPNKGWLRTMFHSLTQQIIRQDLAYWMIYVCLRPDRNHRLVAYPYYAKYAVGGDSTYFRHIDMNIPKDLADGHGGNIIQGSVSLDDETDEGCTEILPGFHQNIREWWARVDERGDATNGHVHSMEGLMLPEDATAYGEFVPVPCQRGDVRITMPEIPHGSTATGSDAQMRRTVLPWFVSVREDGETLDNQESDTWSDLALAYSRQTAPARTPSGLHNKYGPIPYRFPASTQLFLSSPISQALVCRTTWDDPVVQACANVLLGEDRRLTVRMIVEHRLEALRAFRVAWGRVRMAERNFYGADSYFAK